MPADPSSPSTDATPAVDVQLDHASVMTTDLDAAISFYVDLIGLSLRTVEDDPVRAGRQRALLADDRGGDVVELIEMEEMKHPSVPGRGGIHHLGFSLPSREWHSLRSRLDAADHPYEEVEGRLFARDADGLVLEIEKG
ncbi:VOC family protein [Salinibacter altiplanensis]|uniref:VOC family protein n=1 Tax=Salinibacter altiplanensis TaxID=1803181 RepID=UPI000C9F17AC|nr:VOC family protein [Salinibacter altiplanensis]